MKPNDISTDLRNRAFDFFYWFSRFEFALKENKFLKNSTPGSPAEPDWGLFIAAHKAEYRLTEAGSGLVDAAPRRQIVGQHQLEFVPVGFDDQSSELEKVVRLLKTVRNNLFHGGKHGAEGWEDPPRTLLLLNLSIGILNELAEFGGIDADYKHYY